MKSLTPRQKELLKALQETGEELIYHSPWGWGRSGIPFFCMHHQKNSCPKKCREWSKVPKKKDTFQYRTVYAIYKRELLNILNDKHPKYAEGYRFSLRKEADALIAKWDF